MTQGGIEATDYDWSNHVALSLGYVLCGAAGEFYTPGGQRDIDESFLVMMNAYYGDLDFRFPRLSTPLIWEALVDTAEPSGIGPFATASRSISSPPARLIAPATPAPIQRRSLAALAIASSANAAMSPSTTSSSSMDGRYMRAGPAKPGTRW